MAKSIFFFLLLLIFSCQEKTNDCNNCDDEVSSKVKPVSNDELEMYVPSELAALMLEMNEINANWKEEILKGNIPKEFPEKYKNIHTAKSDNENAGTDFYNAMASSYITAIEDLTNASKDNVKEKFNTMVNVCVTCHQQVCPGPISRIQKLIIEE